jgi:hypothetical protein
MLLCRSIQNLNSLPREVISNMAKIIKDKSFNTLEEAESYLNEKGFKRSGTYTDDYGIHTYFHKLGVRGLVRLNQKHDGTINVAQATG